MPFVLSGISHHTAPIGVRERLSIPEHRLPSALTALMEYKGVREAVLLSTCNRVEVYAMIDGASTEQAHDLLANYFASYHHLSRSEFATCLYPKAEHAAAEHLMRVASGLESLIIGEMQILGQVRQALRVAQETETIGSILTNLFQQAITTSRRIQNETGIGRGAFSIGHAAVDLASHIFTDLSTATVLILGAGKMSELTVRHLLSNGVRSVVVANRTFERARQMAEAFGGRAVHYDTFPDELVNADIVIASTAAPHFILRKELLQPIIKRRRGKPLFLIDIAVPRDIDPHVEELNNVFLYNIDDLQAVVEQEGSQRIAEAQRAEVIARDETDKFMTWYRSRTAVPVISQLKSRLEQIRQDDLALLRAKLRHLPEREWQAIETATLAMMNHVAREPILRLKRETDRSAESEPYNLFTATCEIFGLGDALSVTVSDDSVLPAENEVS